MRLRFTRSATRDLTRLREFVARHDPRAAARAGRRLGRTTRLQQDQPELDQAVDELPDAPELVSAA